MCVDTLCSDRDGDAIILNPVRRIRSSVHAGSVIRFAIGGDEHEGFRKEIVKSVHRILCEWERLEFRKFFDRRGTRAKNSKEFVEGNIYRIRI